MAIAPVTHPAQGKAPEKIPEQTPIQRQKASLNVSILKSTEATLSVADQPLLLVLRSAIEAINEHLAPEMGENAIQAAYDAGIDVSPEATAKRIVDLSTGLFSLFQEQHPNEDAAAVLDKFMTVIGEGIDRGFAEAREILDGLGVLKGDIAENIDKTYTLVQEGLAAFKEQFAEQDEQ